MQLVQAVAVSQPRGALEFRVSGVLEVVALKVRASRLGMKAEHL